MSLTPAPPSVLPYKLSHVTSACAAECKGCVCLCWCMSLLFVRRHNVAVCVACFLLLAGLASGSGYSFHRQQDSHRPLLAPPFVLFPITEPFSRLKLNIFYLLRCPNSRHGTVSHSTLTHQLSEFHSKSPMSSKLITFLSSLYVDSNVKQVQNNSTHQKKEKKKAKHRS